jgi:molecular chaperone Hsp33
MPADINQRFLFDGTDVRGELVHVNQAYRDMTAAHGYPAPVRNLLGEMLVAVVLLSGTIKYRGRLILQVRSQGQVPLAMVETSNEGKVRGIARLSPDVTDFNEDFHTLLQDGTLVMTVEPEGGERYQSIVPLLADTFAGCIEAYFAQSEQLGTRLSLAVSEDQAAGILLQQLPPQLITDQAERENQWQHLAILGQSVTAEELLNLNSEALLGRLYVQDPVRLVDQRQVMFECSCSAARAARSIAELGSEQLDYLFEEDDVITVDCEFCLAKYEFTRESLSELVRGDEPSH